MKDPRYDYQITVSAHFIIENDNKILIAKRPETWEWAPGRWSLIGGKLYKEESFSKGIKRKTKQELGFEVQPKGLYQINQLIIEGKQAFMYFFASDYNGEEIQGEMQDYKWIGIEDVKTMKLNEFAEYFYKGMFVKYLSGDKEVFPMSKINSLNYIELENAEDYKKWFEDIINEDFDPEKVDDYKKWKNKTS
jgi:ADP-ribose pyrophosphatase YjhB (NUDIX family)